MKVAAFTTEGQRLCLAVRKNIPIVTPEGYYFDWKYQKRALFDMLKEVTDHGYRILSIGVGSCGEAVYPLDADGNIVDNAIAWYCRRTEREKEEFEKRISERECYKICFLRSFYSYTAHKISWHRRHTPDLFRRTACWLPVDGFINYLLTGTKYFDYNQAGSTLLFDTRKREWSDTLFETNEIPRETFPELIESGRMTGYLTQESKNLSGIDYDVPVSIAGHDAWCGQFALGVGVSEEAEEYIFSFSGTAGGASLGKVVDRKELERRLDEEGIDYFFNKFNRVIPYVYPGKYHCVYQGAIMDYYGALMDFVMRLFQNRKAEEITDRDYAELQKEADSSRPGANGVRMYVAEDDPMNTRDLSGINVLNLKSSNTRGDVFRAVMEYLCLADRKQLQRIGERRKKICLVGGLARNRSFVKIRANMLNMPQYVIDEEETNALGAALLGGIGAEVYKSYEEAVSRVRMRYEDVVEPDPILAREYAAVYAEA